MEKQMKLFTNMTKPFVLFVLLLTLGIGEMWAGTKTVYIDISQFPSYDGDGNIVQVHYWGDGEKTIDATCVVAGVMYKADIPDGASWQVKERKGDWSGNEGNNCSSSQNFYYLTNWSKSGSAGTTYEKTYDGSTYVYWRTNPGSWTAWDTGNPTHKIRLIRVDGGDNLGFVEATDVNTSDHIARYLVPAGTYIRPELYSSFNNSGSNPEGIYTKTFDFSATSTDNFIYNFAHNGGYGNWATTFFARSAYVYFDNTNSEWNNDHNYILMGRDGTSNTYAITKIDNTNNLWCHTSAISYNDFTQFCFVGDDAIWGNESSSVDSRKGFADINTANYQVNMDHSSMQYNLFIPAGKTKGTSLTHSAYGDYTSLNYTQTVEQKLSENGGSTYSTSTRALATVSVNSYKLTSATGTTADGGNIASGQSSKSCDAARTATVTYSVSSVAEGYTFVGWYDGDTEKSTSTTYTYQATEAKTITARFKANAYSVVFDGNDNTSGSMSNQTFYYNVEQNLTSNAYSKNGYSFGGWTTNNDGTGTSYTNGQSVSNWSSTDGASITIFAKWTQSVTLDRESGTSGSTSVTATYNSATLGSYTNPERSGYIFGGYYSGDNGIGELIINTSKVLQANKTDDEDVYTGAGGIWKHAGATTLHAQWTAKEYTINLANMEADEGYEGTTSVTVTFDASTNMTASDVITKPTKTHYDFAGYWTSENTGKTLDHMLIGADGKWIKDVEGYTSHDGSGNPTWVHDYPISLYAKWTEHEYAVTLAISPAGAGSVSCGSSTTAKYVTASGDITATPSPGYSFREWGFSKVGEDDYDVYVSDESTYSSTKDTIRIKAQRDGTLTANFTANGYTVTLEDRGADEGHKGTPNVSVTYDATTNLTSAISKPEKTYYTFDGYWTSNDEGETPITQLIDANGNWKKSISGYTGASGENPTWKYAGNITLYAKWIETKHNVQVAVSPSSPFKTGSVTIGGSEVTEVSVGKIIPTAAMTAVAANNAFLFKEWQLTEHVSRDEAKYSANDNPNSFFAEDDDQTITAVFQTRFGVIGSLKSSDAAGHGMPGWVWSNAVGFDVNGFTDFGEGEGKGVDFRYSTTLDPNTQYKFRLYDRIKDKAIGCAAEDVLPAEDGGGKYHNWQLNHTDDGQDILINTTGRGTYTFHITNISADGNFWPSIQVDRPTSYQLNLGWGYVETVDLTTVKSGNVGGTVTAVATEGGEENPITNGGWVVAGGTITFTPHPADDYVFAGWFTSSDYSSEFGDKLNPLPISSISGTVNVYAKFVEKSTTFEGDVVGHETEWNNTGNWSGGALPTINDIAIITKPVTVDIAHATAKSIVLDQNSNTGKLTIDANQGLEVAGTITRTTDGSNRLATRPEDLILESSSAGNASLIFNNSNSCQATVKMYSIGEIVSESQWNWQFMGTPFTSANALYSYYGSYLYEWKSSGDWDVVPNGGTMTPFTGYCITQSSATTYVMDGTLNPNSDVNISIPAGKEFVMANSWTAPISVCNFTNTTLPLDNKTIYLFNTGFAPKESGDAKQGTAAGTYIAMPINSAIYTGNYLIAPMEGFYVDNTDGSAATITLKYDELVRPSGSHTDIVAGPMHAPKRVAVEAEPDVMKIKATGSRYADRVVILARQDFSTGFDNGWDGKNLNEPSVAPIIYALRADGTKDAVSAIPSFEGTVVGFRQGEDNQYTFSFNYDGEDIWYLNDLKEEKSTLIDAANTYSFVAEAGDAEARFIISATPIQKLPTGIGNDANDAMVKVRKLIINDQLFIIRAGRMYNAVGSIVK